MKMEREIEKRTAQAIMTKEPGFASDDRNFEGAGPPVERTRTSVNTHYDFMGDPAENPYAKMPRPDEEAYSLIADGLLADAIAAFEAALQQTANGSDPDWATHFACWLELGRVFMDLNIDALALRCLNKAAGLDEELEARGAAPMPATRRNALLLRAVCLLNEAETDTLTEVCDCLNLWLDAAGAGKDPFADGSDLLDARTNA